MDFIKRNRADGTFSEAEDVSKWKASDFKQFDLFFVSRISEDNFKNDIRRHEILKTQMEIQSSMEKLQRLQKSTNPNAPNPVPANFQVPSINNPVAPPVIPPPATNPLETVSVPLNTTKGLINPQTKQPFSAAELDAVFAEFVDTIESAAERSDDSPLKHVMNCENNGDHFLVRSNERIPLQKSYKGVPLALFVEQFDH